jgi:hypothetical protein
MGRSQFHWLLGQRNWLLPPRKDAAAVNEVDPDLSPQTALGLGPFHGLLPTSLAMIFLFKVEQF